MSRKRNEDEYTALSIKVESYEVAVGVSVNLNLQTPVPIRYSDDDPVFTPDLKLEFVGTSTYPEQRAGDRYEIVVYGERAEKEQLKLKDIHVRDKHELPVYRTYRGQEIPVFKPPPGIAVLDKRPGIREWSLWVFVVASVARDMLTLLTASRRPLYLSILERKIDRQRWVQSLKLRTTDPAYE